MKKPVQTDIEEAINEVDLYTPQGELADAFTGELFKARARNHYEVNSGIPHAPAVALQRPSIRQRIENLINRDPDLLRQYVNAEDDGSIDMDIPDDADAPLTASEQNFLDLTAATIAEAAPLPDEGLPRPEVPPSKPADAPGGGSPPVATPGVSPPASAAPAAAPAAPTAAPVPTR